MINTVRTLSGSQERLWENGTPECFDAIFQQVFAIKAKGNSIELSEILIAKRCKKDRETI